MHEACKSPACFASCLCWPAVKHDEQPINRHDACCCGAPEQVLRLENNRLEALPDNMGELHTLIKLDVSTNCLRQLPASMGRLKRIQRIDAANNLLIRVPPSMGRLKSIKELNLKYNSLDDRYKAKTDEGLSK